MSALYGVFWTISAVRVRPRPGLSLPPLRRRRGRGRRWRKQVELSRQSRRHRQVEVLESGPGQQPPPRCALHKAFLNQVRLDDLFDDVALVAERRGQSFDADRAAAIIFCDAAQIAAIHAVEPTPIHLEPLEGRVGGGRIDARQPLDSGKISDPAQQPHRDARGAACPPGDFRRAVRA